MTRRKTPAIGILAFFVAAFSMGAYFPFAAVQGDYGLFRRVQIDAERDELTRRIEARNDGGGSTVLLSGDALGWASDGGGQGSVGAPSYSYIHPNGCAAKGTCGAPYSYDGLGGGWQLCFA